MKNADALVLAVGHSSLKALDPVELANKTPARIAVDCVNGWDPFLWQAAGFDLHRLGVGSPK